MRVVVLDDFHRTYHDSAGIARLRQRADVTIYAEPAASRDELVDRLAGVPIVIANRERTHFPADLFPRLPDLELICNTGGHLYHVDVPAATAAGVALQLAYAANPETTGRSTAELTLALMQAVMRRIPQTDRALRAGEWRMPLGEVLYGKTLGIVGLGRVARHRLWHAAAGLGADAHADARRRVGRRVPRAGRAAGRGRRGVDPLGAVRPEPRHVRRGAAAPYAARGLPGEHGPRRDRGRGGAGARAAGARHRRRGARRVRAGAAAPRPPAAGPGDGRPHAAPGLAGRPDLPRVRDGLRRPDHQLPGRRLRPRTEPGGAGASPAPSATGLRRAMLAAGRPAAVPSWWRTGWPARDRRRWAGVRTIERAEATAIGRACRASARGQ